MAAATILDPSCSGEELHENKSPLLWDRIRLASEQIFLCSSACFSWLFFKTHNQSTRNGYFLRSFYNTLQFWHSRTQGPEVTVRTHSEKNKEPLFEKGRLPAAFPNRGTRPSTGGSR
jgi:hypothetical protein